MDPDMNAPQIPPVQTPDAQPTFPSNAPQSDEAAAHFRPQGHFQGPYPTSSPRMRPQGEFQQRGRYGYNRRGGQRPQNRYRQNYQHSHDPSGNHGDQQATNMPYSNRSSHKFFRPSMLEDPWANMKPQKVPEHGTSLIFDVPNH